MDTNELTYLINGCAMKVHSYLGLGFQEKIYQRALAFEMAEANISFEREEPQIIYYKGAELGTRRADFVVNDTVIVELKAISELLPEHFIQTKNYITTYDKPVGLLINFGTKSLQFKKIFPNNRKYSP